MKNFLAIIHESFLNIRENYRIIISSFIFLSVTLLGIIITDSLINSVSETAQQELRIYGDKSISVTFERGEYKDKIDRIFSSDIYNKSFTKKDFFSVGLTPFSESGELITGIDNIAACERGVCLKNGFRDNSAIVNDSDLSQTGYVFINGIPFRIAGVYRKQKTDFLDSLGLDASFNRGGIFIPLDTAIRLNLNSKIDGVKLTMHNKITRSDIEGIKSMLTENNISNFQIQSFFDAEETVNKVLTRFSVLTNTIYILLNISAILIVLTMSRRNFQSRGTEFAIRIIHGIKSSTIRKTVLAETVIIICVSALFSMTISLFILGVCARIMIISLSVRFVILFVSVIQIFIISLVINMYLSNKCFRRNPLDLIKERML